MIGFHQRRPDAPEYLQGFGGATSNAIITAARQGARTACVTRLGSDVFGDRLMALWRAEGVATDALTRDPQAPTRSAKFLHVSGIGQAIGTGACDTVFAASAMARPADVIAGRAGLRQHQPRRRAHDDRQRRRRADPAASGRAGPDGGCRLIAFRRS